MALKKVHKRAHNAAAHHPRQLLGPGTTTTGGTATSVSSFSRPQQNPTGPPLVLPTTTTTPGAVTTTRTSSSITATATNTQTQTTATQTTATATSATGVTNTAATSAPRTSGPATTGTRTVITRAGTSSTGSPTATQTGDNSDGMGLGSIAGAAAAAVIAIGVIAAFAVWFIRRKKRNSDPDEEPFNRNSFLRHSTAIPDDDGPVPSRARTAPNMIERQLTPLYGSTATFDGAQSGFGYNTQPSYSAGQLFPPNSGNPFGPGGAPATPLPSSPGFGTAYDQQGYNNAGYSELTRGSVHDYPPSPQLHDQFSPQLENPHSPNYPGPETFPVPSSAMNPPDHDVHAGEAGAAPGIYTQPNYPELTPATAAAQHGQVVSVTSSVHDGRETPVQLGFAPVQMPAANQQAYEQPKQQDPRKQRPETMYNDEDAYGGI